MPDPLIGELSGEIGDLGHSILVIAMLLTAVGTLSMAFVELAKTVLRLQMRYHHWSIQHWTCAQPRHLGILTRALLDYRPFKRSQPFMETPILSELILLATGGHDEGNALFDQPIEKMMGQIQAAVNVAMDFPDDYPKLYEFITKVPLDYQMLSTQTMIRVGHALNDQHQSDYELWRAGAQNLHNARMRPANATVLTDAQHAQAQEAAKARTRLNNLVARKLDSFQNETRYLWERLNQWFATALCTGLFAWMLHVVTSSNNPVFYLLAIPAGIAAPFAKDVTTSLVSFGRK